MSEPLFGLVTNPPVIKLGIGVLSLSSVLCLESAGGGCHIFISVYLIISDLDDKCLGLS